MTASNAGIIGRLTNDAAGQFVIFAYIGLISVHITAHLPVIQMHSKAERVYTAWNGKLKSLFYH